MATKDAPPATQSAKQADKFGEFKPIKGSTETTLHVLETNANHPTSMKLLEDIGLMPYTKTEILSILVKDEQLKEFLKGKWFYLESSGTKENGLYTINEDGRLTKGKGQSIENTVRVWQGDNPLSFGVNSDNNAADCGRRFDLSAFNGPHNVAPVVMGKPKLKLSENVDALLKEIVSAAGNLSKSASHEDLEKKSRELGVKAADLAKMLRPTEL